MSTDKTPKKKTPAPKPDKHGKASLRYPFNNAEFLELGKKMAEAANDLAGAEDEKKAITSQLKAKVDGIQSRVNEYSQKIIAGFEYRDIPITTKYHKPLTGFKQTTRDDTGAIIAEEPMTEIERQDELPLDESKKPLTQPVLNPEDVRRVTPGTVSVDADEGTTDTEGA